MTSIQNSVEDWLLIFDHGSIAEQLFSYEEINNRLGEYSAHDINYVIERLFPFLLETLKRAEAPNEILLIIADIMTKMSPYIQDEDVRRGVFIHASRCVRHFLSNIKHVRIMTNLMLAYQEEKGSESVQT